MRYRQVKLSAILLLGLGLIELHAQETIPASGGNASSSGGSVSYSVGQVFYTSISAPEGSVSQGVQQPFEILVVTAIEEANGIALLVSAYPNPATDYLQLKIENYDSESLFYQLYNLNGKLLIHKKVEDNITSIPMKSFVPGTYFLNISNNKKEVKSFRIIKY